MLLPGFVLRETQVYAAEEGAPPPPETDRALRQGKIAAAAFFSPRSAAIFNANVPAGWADALSRMTAVAISEAAADRLDAARFGRVVIADQPDAEAMRAALCGACE